ncbi:MAG: TIGR01906 family membrane protein [Erysipelotrichaceae bacterium]|nr:TIGR01906 family membrane protein [Erysipelotrichaceae bacterium]
MLFSIHFWCFNESFYRSEHSKLKLYGKGIAEYIGISEEDLDELTSFTLDYLNDPKADLNIQMNVKGEKREIFTDDEKAHMVDVQRLNLAANVLLVISGLISIAGIVFCLIRKKMYNLFHAYRKTLAYVMTLIGVLVVWIVIDFDSFWTMFHHLFFPGNDLWLLDLRSDILIMIVPPEFFNHLVLMIVSTFIFIIIASYLLLKKTAERGE